jgi:hypothetical protein
MLRVLPRRPRLIPVQEYREAWELLVPPGRPSLALAHGQVDQLVLQLIGELLQHQVRVIVHVSRGFIS